MPQTFFKFKQFTVHQDRCAMKVGTDSVLLGAWTCYSGTYSVLDIGTGTGVLALIAAQFCPAARIDAVELDPPAAVQAAENVRSSPWHGRIRVHQADIRQWQPAAKYDLVLCNPPFYKGHSASQDARMATAKHEGMLSMEDLIRAVVRSLAKGGRLNMIVPADRWAGVCAVAAAHGFFPLRTGSVCYRAGKAPKRMLAEFVGNRVPTIHENLTLQDAKGHFTAEYRGLLSELELHF